MDLLAKNGDQSPLPTTKMLLKVESIKIWLTESSLFAAKVVFPESMKSRNAGTEGWFPVRRAHI